MATDTAAAPPAHSRRRNFWQLPTFVLGVAAAVAAYAAFPPPPVTPADRLGRQLAELRQAIDRRPVNRGTVEVLASQAAAAAEQFPESAPLIHFLVGSGYLALAETVPADPDAWSLAATHLARVEEDGLPDPLDRQRLAFRRAKAVAAVGAGDPAALLPTLANPPPGEDPDGERRRLLADVALRTDPPDLRRARDELHAYLTGPVRMPAPTLARYRLRLSEVYLALNEPDKARTWLKEVGTAAPPDVQAQARVQLARMAAAENNWPEAVRLYETAQQTPGLPAEQRAAIHYQTGVGYVHLRDPAAAAPHFEQAAAGSGPVAVAAAVRLAELILRDPTARGIRSKAVDLLDRAVPPAQGSEFRNPYLSADEVRAAFEEAITVCLNEAEYGTAVRAATAYGKVAAGGRDRERRAEVNAAWAAVLHRSAGPAQAAARFKEAADDYLHAAAGYPTPDGKADLLRRAADCLRRAGDTASAEAVIDQLTRTPGMPEDAQAAAWLEKGEILLAGGRFPEGVEALQKAMAGPSAAVARVRLAVAHLDQAKQKGATPAARAEAQALTAFAQQLLTQAANTTAVTQPEREAHRQALYELGKLLLTQGNFPDAEARFRQLLQAHPTGPSAGPAKLYLGSCLLLLARGAHQDSRPPADADRKLDEALKLFRELSESDDEFLKTQADIRLANATLMLKRYDDMPALCERLAERYRGKVEELIVLSMLYSAYAYAERPEPAARTFERMREVFARLGPDAFPGGPEEYTREYWVTTWFEPRKAKP
jgi:FimV-like protein